jgi:hypothetical protein
MTLLLLTVNKNIDVMLHLLMLKAVIINKGFISIVIVFIFSNFDELFCFYIGGAGNPTILNG